MLVFVDYYEVLGCEFVMVGGVCGDCEDLCELVGVGVGFGEVVGFVGVV